jgi:uncharacterized protein
MSLFDDNSLPPDLPESSAIEPIASPPAAAPVRDLPPDLRVPWDWLDLLLLAVLALAGSVLLSLLLGRMFAAFGVKFAQLRASPSETGLFTILHQVLLFSALLGYLAVQIRVTFGMPFWRTIGWRALDRGRVPRALQYVAFVVGGFLMAASVQTASVAFGNRAKVPMQTLFQDRRTALLLILTAVLLAPVIEETVFRGYIYPVVARRFGVAAGIVGTGILFGLLHAPQLWGGWVQIALLVGVGVILTLARAATRTVLASYLLHMSYNFFTSFAFLLGSHWLRLLPPSH